MSVLINLSALLDDAKCFELVRQTRWPQGVRCPKCGGEHDGVERFASLEELKAQSRFLFSLNSTDGNTTYNYYTGGLAEIVRQSGERYWTTQEECHHDKPNPE